MSQKNVNRVPLVYPHSGMAQDNDDYFWLAHDLREYFYFAEGKAQRRAKRYGANIIPIDYYGLADKVIVYQYVSCAYCANDLTWEGMTLDHVIPLSSGYREHSLRNLVVCCKSCNSSKQDTPVFEWLKERDLQVPDWLKYEESKTYWFRAAYKTAERDHPVYGDTRLSRALSAVSLFTVEQRLKLNTKISKKITNRQERLELIKMFERLKMLSTD